MSPIQISFRGAHGHFAYQTLYSAGADLCAQRPSTVEQESQRAWANGIDPNAPGRWIIRPGQSALIPTGVFITAAARVVNVGPIEMMPVMAILPRSGLSKRGIVAATGTIDADFKSEICVILRNFSEAEITINLGDRIAQLVGYLCFQMDGVEVKDRTRGYGGFGSTGGTQ